MDPSGHLVGDGGDVAVDGGQLGVDHDPVDVDRRDDHRQRRPQATSGLGGGVRVERAVGAAVDGGHGRHRFQTALEPAAAGIAVGLDHDVADLARREVLSGVERPVEYQPGADAVADGDYEQGVAAFRGSQFGEGG